MYGLHGATAKAEFDFSQLGGERVNIILCMFYNQAKSLVESSPDRYLISQFLISIFSRLLNPFGFRSSLSSQGWRYSTKQACRSKYGPTATQSSG